MVGGTIVTVSDTSKVIFEISQKCPYLLSYLSFHEFCVASRNFQSFQRHPSSLFVAFPGLALRILRALNDQLPATIFSIHGNFIPALCDVTLEYRENLRQVTLETSAVLDPLCGGSLNSY